MTIKERKEITMKYIPFNIDNKESWPTIIPTHNGEKLIKNAIRTTLLAIQTNETMKYFGKGMAREYWEYNTSGNKLTLECYSDIAPFFFKL